MSTPHLPSLDRSEAELFVSAPLVAILEGIYKSRITLSELLDHGNCGIGTFDDLDGEMILLDGEFFQIRSDGKAYRPRNDTQTPFACTTFFRGDTTDRETGNYPWEKFEELLHNTIPSDNMIYTLRVDANFERIKVRSVPKQECPKPLVEVAREQPTFEYRDIRGTLIGFYNPSFIVPVNAPGFHLHFIDDQRKVGGHLLSCDVHDPEIRVQHVPSMRLGLPMNIDFLTAELETDVLGDIKEAESGR
jgi:acetolactate decarboxylase